MGENQIRKLYSTAILGSFLLSFLAVLIDPVVNNDGIWYLSVAKIFAMGEWKLALQSDVYYQWPFYSLLIGTLSRFTGIDVELSAWLLNAFFIATIVIVFVEIARELGADRKTQWIALAVILLFPAINEYRSFVIRDMGFLACYSAGLLFFMKSLRTGSPRHAVVWSLFMMVAFLFRTEALGFLVVAPLVIFTLKEISWPERIRQYIRNNILVLLVAVPAITVFAYTMLTSPGDDIAGLFFLHADRVLSAILDGNNTISRAAAHLHEGFLAEHPREFSFIVAVAALLSVFVYKLVSAMTLPYLLLWWYARRNGVSFFSERTGRIWIIFVLVSVVMVLLHQLTTVTLVTRYILALVYTLLLCIPFYLAWLHGYWIAGGVRSRYTRGMFYMVAVLAVALVLDPFVSTGGGKGYLREAGGWLKTNMREGERLFSSNIQVAYYANQVNLLDYKSKPDVALQHIRNVPWGEVKSLLDSEKHRDYDFLAIKLRKGNDGQIAYVSGKVGHGPDNLFMNNKGDTVAIFRTREMVR